MDNFTLFVCGLVVTLVAGMGVIISEVFLGYRRFPRKKDVKEYGGRKNDTIKQTV